MIKFQRCSHWQQVKACSTKSVLWQTALHSPVGCHFESSRRSDTSHIQDSKQRARKGTCAKTKLTCGPTLMCKNLLDLAQVHSLYVLRSEGLIMDKGDA